MVSGVQLKQHVLGTIDARRDDIIGVGESIMDAPELGFKETKTDSVNNGMISALHGVEHK